MLETLVYSAESESFMAAAYSHQLQNLPQQLHDYAYRIYHRTCYRWVNNRIVHPVPLEESRFWNVMREAMYDTASALIHIELGIGEWCQACRFNYGGHQAGIDRGARILGLR
jgi:hypothetical protein